MSSTSKAVHDPVNSPRHYCSHPSGIECVELAEHIGFNLGNALKYIWRAGEKNDRIEDLRKSVWYLEREEQRRSNPAIHVGPNRDTPFRPGFSIGEVIDHMNFNLGAAIENIWIAYQNGGEAKAELQTAAAQVRREIQKYADKAAAGLDYAKLANSGAGPGAPTLPEAQAVLALGDIGPGKLSKTKLGKRTVSPILRAACLANAAIARRAHADKRRAGWNQMLAEAASFGIEANAAHILDPEQVYRRAILRIEILKSKKKAERKAAKLAKQAAEVAQTVSEGAVLLAVEAQS